MIIMKNTPTPAAGVDSQTTAAADAQKDGQFSAQLKKRIDPGHRAKDEATHDTSEANNPTGEVSKTPEELTAPEGELPAISIPQANNDPLNTVDFAVSLHGQIQVQPQIQTDITGAVTARVDAPSDPAKVSAQEMGTVTIDPLSKASLASLLTGDVQTNKSSAPTAVSFKLPEHAAPGTLKAKTEGQSVLASAQNTDTATSTTMSPESLASTRNHPLPAIDSGSLIEPLHNAGVTHITAVQSVTTAVPTQPTPGVATGVLQSEVGSPAWQQSLGQQIAVFSREGVHYAELRLHPEELGALQISLRMNNDQAQIHFVSEHYHVRAALESAMPTLRNLLEQSGIELGQNSVGAETFSSAGDTPSEERSGSASSDKTPADDLISLQDERQSPLPVTNYSPGINTFA